MIKKFGFELLNNKKKAIARKTQNLSKTDSIVFLNNHKYFFSQKNNKM
jgi:hypothetical protein